MNNTKQNQGEILVKEIKEIQQRIKLNNIIILFKTTIFVGLIAYAFYLKM